jgi:hypothetical protein
MPMLRSALVALTASVLVLAPAAGAAEPAAVAYRPDLAQAPALAGDRVLWMEGIVAVDVFGAPIAGGPVQKLVSTGADWPRPLDLAASPTHAALAFQEESTPDREGDQEYLYSRLLAGPSIGPLAFRGGSPDDEPSGDRVYGAELAGDVLVAVRSAPGAESGVSDRPARITIQDLGTGAPETDLVAAGNATLGPQVSAAGPFVAYTAAGAQGAVTLVVLDRTSRAEVTRLALARAPVSFDVQADGTVAVSEPTGTDTQRIGWARPGDPALRPLVERTLRSGHVLAGDRVAHARAAAAGGVEIVLTSLDGTTVPASFAMGSPTGFDFDGTRLAFATSDCVYAAIADAVPAGAAPPAGPCPRAQAHVRPVRAKVALTRKRRTVEVRLSCPMATDRGCRGRVALYYTRRSYKPARLARRDFALARGAERELTLRVPARLLRALRHRRGNQLGITARTVDEQGRVALTGDEVRVTRPKRRVR